MQIPGIHVAGGPRPAGAAASATGAGHSRVMSKESAASRVSGVRGVYIVDPDLDATQHHWKWENLAVNAYEVPYGAPRVLKVLKEFIETNKQSGFEMMRRSTSLVVESEGAAAPKLTEEDEKIESQVRKMRQMYDEKAK